MLVQSTIAQNKVTVLEWQGIADPHHPKMVQAGMYKMITLANQEGSMIVIYMSRSEYEDMLRTIKIDQHIV